MKRTCTFKPHHVSMTRIILANEKDQHAMHSHIQKHAHWYALLIVVVLAAAAFLPGYNYGLPLYHNDEGLFLRELLARNGLLGYEIDLPGYPPALLMLYQYSYYIAQALTSYDVTTDNPQLIIQNLRLVSGLVNVVTAGVIFLTGRRLGNTLVGFVAAVAWAMMPYITFRTLVALTESWLVLFYTLTLYGVVRAVQEDKPFWAGMSVLAGLFAVVFKYSSFIILGMGVGVTVWKIWEQRANAPRRTAWLRSLGLQFLMILGCAFLLFFVYDAGNSTQNTTPSRFISGGVLNIFSRFFELDVLQRLFEVSATRNGVILPLFLLVLLSGGAVYLLTEPRWRRIAWIFAVGGWFVHVAFIATYLIYPLSHIKYPIPATGLSILAFTTALFALCAWAGRLIRVRRMGTILFIFVSLLWVVPHAVNQYGMTVRRTLPNTITSLQEWASPTIGESGTIFLSSIPYQEVFGDDLAIPWIVQYGNGQIENYNDWMIFDPLWGGYNGRLLPWIAQDGAGSFSDRSIDEWRDLHVNYILIPDSQLQRMAADPGQNALLDELLLLRSFPPAGNTQAWRGPHISVFRLWRMEEETDIAFGDVARLVGYDLSAERATPAETISFTPYWQPIRTPETNYNVYAHLVPLDSREVLAQADGQPSRSERPMVTWNAAEETIIGQPLELVIPADIPEGRYRLIVGLYDLETGERLFTASGEDFTLIEMIAVR